MSHTRTKTKGTTSSNFQIGTEGATIFQGPSNPNTFTFEDPPENGDVFIQKGSSGVGFWQLTKGTWRRVGHE